jgi:hypothetical protein
MVAGDYEEDALTALNLKDLKSKLTHTEAHEAIGPIADSVAGRASSRGKRASELVSFDKDGKVAIRGAEPSDISIRIDDLKELEEDIAEFKKDGINARSMERMLEKDRSAISKEGKKILSNLGRGHDYHTDAINAYTKEESRVLEALQKDFTKKRAALTRTKPATEAARLELREQINNLKDNHELVKDSVRDHFDNLREVHTDALHDINGVVKDIEKTTGLSAAEHMKTKSMLGATEGASKGLAPAGRMTETAYKDLGVFSKAATDIKANWEHGGAGGKLKVGIGALFMADAVRRAIKGGSALMSGDPEKQAEGGWSDLVIAVPEALGAGFVATLGGKNHALGLGA